MTEMALPSWTRCNDIAYVERDDRVVVLVLNVPDAVPIALEGSGAIIWGFIDGQADSDTISRSVADLYGVTMDDVSAVVQSFLERLESAGVLERRSAT